jgi:hypothetical protein
LPSSHQKKSLHKDLLSDGYVGLASLLNLSFWEGRAQASQVTLILAYLFPLSSLRTWFWFQQSMDTGPPSGLSIRESLIPCALWSLPTVDEWHAVTHSVCLMSCMTLRATTVHSTCMPSGDSDWMEEGANEERQVKAPHKWMHSYLSLLLPWVCSLLSWSFLVSICSMKSFHCCQGSDDSCVLMRTLSESVLAIGPWPGLYLQTVAGGQLWSVTFVATAYVTLRMHLISTWRNLPCSTFFS